MKVIGLTGGIGAGKSTVSAYLREKGFYVIDADQIARELTQKGSQTLTELSTELGDEILNNDSSLNRKKLAKIVFSDQSKKEILERLTTDVVIEKVKTLITSLRQTKKYCIIFLDAPLLFESGINKETDAVWLVSADENTRISRVIERDGVTREEVALRIANQMDEKTKKALAEEVIYNSGGKDELYKKIELLLSKYA